MPGISIELNPGRANVDIWSILEDGKDVCNIVWQGLNSPFREEALPVFDLVKVRSKGVRPYGKGHHNTADVMFEINIFYRPELSNKKLDESCQFIAEQYAKKLQRRVIVEAYAGNLHGFGEARPE